MIGERKMPGIMLTISGEPDDHLARRLAEDITDLTCSVLRKLPSKTMVMVRYVPHHLWFIDKRPLSAWGKNSFRLEVTISRDTNTREEKAEFHRRAFALLSQALGEIHPHSNIHIIDCSAAGYGYGGITQEHRFQHAEPQP
jgi:4-oxalocrotonate tautomerase